MFLTPVLLAGSEAQKQTYIPPVIAADWKPFSAALIEPAFDFDPNDLKTTARADPEKAGALEYVLDGAKTCVRDAAEAEAVVVYATLDGITQAFIVTRNTYGLSVSASS